MAFEQRPDGSEAASPVNLREGSSRQGNRKCEGSEAGVSLQEEQGGPCGWSRGSQGESPRVEGREPGLGRITLVRLLVLPRGDRQREEGTLILSLPTFLAGVFCV